MPVLLTPVLLFALAMALLGQFKDARAATLTVCATPAGDYSTIQAAVNAAAAGDVIQICAGTYNESVDLNAMASPGDLTLVGNGAVTVTDVTSALFVDTYFEGNLTILNINASSTGDTAVSLTGGITGSLVISGGSASGSTGSGLLVTYVEGPVYITGTTFLSNTGNGLYIDSLFSPAGCALPTMPISDAVHLNNIRIGQNGADGAVVTTGYGNIVVEASSADGNYGHGFSLVNEDYCSGSRIVVRNSSANGNGADQFGYGSGFALNGPALVVHDTQAEANLCDGIEQTYRGSELPRAAGAGGNSCGTSQPRPASLGANATAPAAVNNGSGPSLTVEISNTTVFANERNGIHVGPADLVTITSVSAISNTVNGIRLPYSEQPLGLGAAGIGLSPMTAAIADSLVISNAVGIELNDMLLGYPAGGVGPEVPGITAVVNGNIVCANTTAGLAATGYISHTFDATNNYWGSFSGPQHATKNPAGSGNQVVDAANPSTFPAASGDVLIAPWVSSGSSVIVPAAGVAGKPQEVSVYFPADALPGLTRGPGDPNGGPLFTIATNNGVLTTTFGSGAAAPASIGAGSALTATLTPATAGSATISVSGPCGLVYSVVVPVIAPSISVTKSVGTDPNACAAPGPVTVPISSTLFYCLNVANTGNITLTSHLVTDAQLGIINVPVTYTLAPGASVPITRSLIPALGPILMTRSITNVVVITSTAVFSEIGGIIIEPELSVAVQSAGAVRVTTQPTGLPPGEEPAADKRLYLPALGR
jgi:hypothetical protein